MKKIVLFFIFSLLASGHTNGMMRFINRSSRAPQIPCSQFLPSQSSQNISCSRIPPFSHTIPPFSPTHDFSSRTLLQPQPLLPQRFQQNLPTRHKYFNNHHSGNYKQKTTSWAKPIMGIGGTLGILGLAAYLISYLNNSEEETTNPLNNHRRLVILVDAAGVDLVHNVSQFALQEVFEQKETPVLIDKYVLQANIEMLKNLNLDEWNTYEIAQDHFLLIPQAYLQKIGGDDRHGFNLENAEKITSFDAYARSGLLKYWPHFLMYASKLPIVSGLFKRGLFHMIENRWCGKFINCIDNLFDQSDESKQYRWDIVIKGHGADKVAYTCGMPDKSFKHLLNIANEKITTHSFLYLTCFGGGSRFIDLFETNGEPDIYHFPIFCAGGIDGPISEKYISEGSGYFDDMAKSDSFIDNTYDTYLSVADYGYDMSIFLRNADTTQFKPLSFLQNQLLASDVLNNKNIADIDTLYLDTPITQQEISTQNVRSMIKNEQHYIRSLTNNHPGIISIVGYHEPSHEGNPQQIKDNFDLQDITVTLMELFKPEHGFECIKKEKVFIADQIALKRKVYQGEGLVEKVVEEARLINNVQVSLCGSGKRLLDKEPYLHYNIIFADENGKYYKVKTHYSHSGGTDKIDLRELSARQTKKYQAEFATIKEAILKDASKR